jgi:hypothetical protein
MKGEEDKEESILYLIKLGFGLESLLDNRDEVGIEEGDMFFNNLYSLLSSLIAK